MFPDLVPSLLAAGPDLRGRLLPNVLLSDLTWLRLGGPAQVLFTPADEDDLAYFLSRCPLDIPVMVAGVGSNLLVRDGGVPGVVIRLARGFNEAVPINAVRIRAGAAVPDVRLAQVAASAGIGVTLGVIGYAVGPVVGSLMLSVCGAALSLGAFMLAPVVKLFRNFQP